MRGSTDSDGWLQYFPTRQFTLLQALVFALGVPLVLFLGMIALSYPGIATGVVLGGVVVTVGRRLSVLLEDRRRRGGRAVDGGTPKTPPGHH